MRCSCCRARDRGFSAPLRVRNVLTWNNSVRERLPRDHEQDCPDRRRRDFRRAGPRTHPDRCRLHASPRSPPIARARWPLRPRRASPSSTSICATVRPVPTSRRGWRAITACKVRVRHRQPGADRLRRRRARLYPQAVQRTRDPRSRGARGRRRSACRMTTWWCCRPEPPRAASQPRRKRGAGCGDRRDQAVRPPVALYPCRRAAGPRSARSAGCRNPNASGGTAIAGPPRSVQRIVTVSPVRQTPQRRPLPPAVGQRAIFGRVGRQLVEQQRERRRRTVVDRRCRRRSTMIRCSSAR